MEVISSTADHLGEQQQQHNENDCGVMSLLSGCCRANVGVVEDDIEVVTDADGVISVLSRTL